MTTAQSTAAAAEQTVWLRLGLIAVAIIELLGGLSSVPVLFSEGPGFTGWAFAARIVLVPLLAIAALLFALWGDLRGAITALSSLVLMTWLAEMITSLFLSPQPFTFGTGLIGAQLLAQTFVYPMIGIGAFVLAYRNEQLVLAGLFASLPTIIGILMGVAFGIEVAIYGF